MTGAAVTDKDARLYAIVVWGLLVASAFSFAVTALAGVILAYVKRDDTVGTPYESHMVSAIRTFWISVVAGIVGFVLSFVGIRFLILALLFVWQLVRVIRGLVYAIDGKPIAHPRGWL